MRKFYLLIILFLFTCGVKQPVDTIETIATGDIFVQSGSISGEILLNGQKTGKQTPDTLFNVPVGWHIVQVIKDAYRCNPDSLKTLVEKNKLGHAQFELEKLIQIGFVEIETIPSDGEIFVDEQTTGKFTPDTIQAEAGMHKIQIRKNGYLPFEWEIEVIQDSLQNLQATLQINQRILLESFGNVSCTPCVDAANNLHEFVNSENVDQYAIVEYFGSWPNPNDPFYKESPQHIDSRLAYYNVASLPALRISGAQKVDATNYSNIISTYHDLLATQNTPIGLSIEKQLIEGMLNVSVEIYNFEDNLTNNQLRLYVAVIENSIHFDNPPGSNGLKDFDFVFRSFLSSNEGDTIQSDSHSQKFEYSMKWKNWNYSNSKVIAFIQTISSKQIIQTTIK